VGVRNGLGLCGSDEVGEKERNVSEKWLMMCSLQDVVPVVGNTTILDVAGGAWSGEYARLEIEGCWEEDGDGATVGEFVLIGGS